MHAALFWQVRAKRLRRVYRVQDPVPSLQFPEGPTLVEQVSNLNPEYDGGCRRWQRL